MSLYTKGAQLYTFVQFLELVSCIELELYLIAVNLYCPFSCAPIINPCINCWFILIWSKYLQYRIREAFSSFIFHLKYFNSIV